MSDVATYAFIGGLFGIFIVLEIVMLIMAPKKIAHSSLDEASKEVQKGSREWVTTVIALVLADIIIWLWLGQKVPLRFFLCVLLGLNMMLLLLALLEYQSLHLSKKRVGELELHQRHEVDEQAAHEKE